MDWNKINLSMIAHTEKMGWPVIVVRHGGVALTQEYYKPFTGPEFKNVHYVDTMNRLRNTPVSDEEWTEFWSKPTWLDEIGLTKETAPRKGRWVRRGDAIQYNKLGYKIIAEQLAEKIDEITNCCNIPRKASPQ